MAVSFDVITHFLLYWKKARSDVAQVLSRSLSWYASINGHCIKKNCRPTAMQDDGCVSNCRKFCKNAGFQHSNCHCSPLICLIFFSLLVCIPPSIAFYARPICHARIFIFISMWCPRLPITIIIIIFNANCCQGSWLEKFKWDLVVCASDATTSTLTNFDGCLRILWTKVEHWTMICAV